MLTPLSRTEVKGIGVLPYPNHITCKYRHSTLGHRLVVGFVSAQALILLFIKVSNIRRFKLNANTP